MSCRRHHRPLDSKRLRSFLYTEEIGGSSPSRTTFDHKDRIELVALEFKEIAMGRKSKKASSIYPVEFEGKMWEEKDCGDVFTAVYHDRAALRGDGAVYVGDGVYVYPNGKFLDEDPDR